MPKFGSLLTCPQSCRVIGGNEKTYWQLQQRNPRKLKGWYFWGKKTLWSQLAGERKTYHATLIDHRRGEGAGRNNRHYLIYTHERQKILLFYVLRYAYMHTCIISRPEVFTFHNNTVRSSGISSIKLPRNPQALAGSIYKSICIFKLHSFI